jgi:hypothetical protein
MHVEFRIFQSSFSSWTALFQEAADFAGTLPTDRLITVSHSCDKGDGVVCVWFWADDKPEDAEASER